MKTTTCGLAVSSVLAGLAIGLAGPAAAEPLDGPYTATITQANPAGQGANVGDTMSVMLFSCGADCTTLLSGASSGWVGDLHLQGNTWAGPVSNAHTGHSCTATLYNGSPALVLDCPAIPANVQYSMVRKA